LKTYYDKSDLKEEPELGKPGEYPFVRGVYTTMYRGKPWTMRQYAGFGTAEETNERFKYLLKQWARQVFQLAFDLPTHDLDVDSDDSTFKWRGWKGWSCDINS